MAKEKDDDDKNLEQNDQDDLEGIEIVIDDGQEASGKKKEDGKADDEKDDDDRRAKSGGEERGGKDRDEQHADADDANLSPEEREKRQRRRAERKLRKERREEERRELEELRREVSDLREAVGKTDRVIKTGEYKRVEHAFAESVRQMEEAKRLLNDAKEKENWGAHAEALEAYMEARGRAAQLQSLRNQIAAHNEREGGGGEERESRPDPVVERKARAWRSNNSWYDPEGRDEDSRIAALIDNGLVAEGYDPKSDEYWRELDKRLARRLPHLVRTREDAADADDDLDDRGSPTSGSGRERAPSGKRTYHISKERLAALKELGVDTKDPQAMKPYVKRFMEWDKTNADQLKR